MSAPPSRGFAHFELFSQACRAQIPLSFVHYSYRKRTFSAVFLHPFLIKEFDNKWYLFGYSEKHGGVRHFGFDRIYSPQLLKRPFLKFDTTATFETLAHSYGVFPIPGKKKQRVTLKVSRGSLRITLRRIRCMKVSSWRKIRMDQQPLFLKLSRP